MIPTLLLFGFLFGRWWKTALIVGTLGWLIILWADPGTRSFDPAFIVSAAALALANTAVGVVIHQLLRLLWHLLRRLIKPSRPASPTKATRN